MAYEKLSDREKKMIERYIEVYGSTPDRSINYAETRASLEHVLRHWDSDKQDLQKLLDGNLILTKHVQIDVDTQIIARNLQTMYYSTKTLRGVTTYSSIFKKFFDWLAEVARWHFNYCLEQKYISGWYYTPIQEQGATPVYAFTSSWFDYDNLALNTFQEVSGIMYFPDSEKPFQVKHGMRLSRILDRAMKAYNSFTHPVEPWYTEEDLRNVYDLIAIARSSSNNSFDLNLSIHPLDFMTMSDNDMHWSSCMSWKDHTGDYRLGTVECMNSPHILMAYISQPEQMNLQFYADDERAMWTNKSWRQLFLVSTEGIVAIKGYPFQYDGVVEVVLDWIKELAKKNWGITYDFDGYINPDYRVFDNDGTPLSIEKDGTYSNLSIDVEWGYMYNDIGTLAKHRVCINTAAIIAEINHVAEPIQNYTIWFVGSGASECMWCGNDITEEDGEDGEVSNMVMCSYCCPGGRKCCCDYCGDRYYNDELYYVDDLDSYLCEDCYSNHVYRDTITDRYVWDDSITEIEMVLGKDAKTGLLVLSNQVMTTCGNTDYTHDELGLYFNDPENFTTLLLKEKPYWHSHQNVVFYQDLTSKGKEFFLDFYPYSHHRQKYQTIEDVFAEICRRKGIIPLTDEEVASFDRNRIYGNIEHESLNTAADLQYNNFTRYPGKTLPSNKITVNKEPSKIYFA